MRTRQVSAQNKIMSHIAVEVLCLVLVSRMDWYESFVRYLSNFEFVFKITSTHDDDNFKAPVK